MTLLLYCVFAAAPRQEHPAPAGLEGRPVSVLTGGRLAAAVSSVSPAELIPTLPRVLAYRTVVDAFFRARTIVPLRYGATLAHAAEVSRYLEREARRFALLLEELDGCVEMGIRVLQWPKTADSAAELQLGLPRPAAPGRGRAYLSERKSKYPEEEESAGQRSRLISRCRHALAGTFAKIKVEEPGVLPRQLLHVPAEQPVLSLYFLVPKAALASFRAAYERLGREHSGALVLSGPWPPYNFVTG